MEFIQRYEILSEKRWEYSEYRFLHFSVADIFGSALIIKWNMYLYSIWISFTFKHNHITDISMFVIKVT